MAEIEKRNINSRLDMLNTLMLVGDVEDLPLAVSCTSSAMPEAAYCIFKETKLDDKNICQMCDNYKNKYTPIEKN